MVLDNALDTLHRVFGFSAFRGIQEEVVKHLLAGGDALVLMPTGGGKSLCYQLPALVRPGLGLVISPLIALMQDQVSALQQMGVKAAFLNSSLTPDESRRICRAIYNRDLQLLYVSPERALMSGFLDMLVKNPLSLIAIDEAHCVSQWGHDFRPEYLQLAQLCAHFPGVPRVALTATADEMTRRDIVERLELQDVKRFITSFDRPNIHYAVHPKSGVSSEDRRSFLHFLQHAHPGEAGIVYCRTRKKVEKTAEWLRGEGFDAYPYHAGMSNEDRQLVLKHFMDEEGAIVVATVAFGMGIDKPNVRFVAHLDMPKSLEAYYQETGRAGRDGLPASAWLTYGVSDLMSILSMLEHSEADAQHKMLERRKLYAMLGFCESVECRRKVLLRYFGEEYEGPGEDGSCHNCDACCGGLRSLDEELSTVMAQKAMSAVARTGERYGVTYLVDLLMGRVNGRLQENGHDRLPTFGVGRDYGFKVWYSVFRQLAAAGFLYINMEHGGLRLTKLSGDVLRGLKKIKLRSDTLDSMVKVKSLRKCDVAGGKQVELSGEEDSRDTQELFELLRQKRLVLARINHVPPYHIFHDNTLMEMARRRPATLEEMLQINGVGLAKLRKFGELFLEITNPGAVTEA